jgi:hypothetical protein
MIVTKNSAEVPTGDSIASLEPQREITEKSRAHYMPRLICPNDGVKHITIKRVNRL